MSLQEKLSAFKARFESGQPPFEAVPAAAHEVMQRALDELRASGIAERAVRSGPAPVFALEDANGMRVSIGDLLMKGAVVLSFYRGAWCPYCNIELQELELHAARIRSAGATLVTVTPQSAANSRKVIEQHKLSYLMLSDPGNAVAEQYGLRYRMPDYLVALYRQLGVDLPAFNGDPSWTLPMPARYVIDRQGEIRYAKADPDYTRRPEPLEVIPVLEALTRSAA
ncbi:peroxiredoxin-like family protein [Dongia sp. agr-C8]